MARPVDAIEIQTDSGRFDRFASIELLWDLFDSATATFTIGDDSTWKSVEKIVAPGQVFRVYCNGFLQFTGRAEVDEVPVEASSGTIVTVTCRTKLSDARYASADPKTRFQNTSVKDFVLKLFEPLGYLASDFQFAPAADVDLVTGKSKGGGAPPTDLEPLKFDQAKVNPPETIFEAATKHLKRHHMMIWDAADGRICVGRPDDTQDPRYRFLCKRGSASGGNNLLGARRIIDWSEVCSDLTVFGGSPGKDVTKTSIRGVATDLDLLNVAANNGHFKRPVILPVEGVKTADQAAAHAQRELAARSRRKDAWEFETDGWSYWDGSSLTNYAINATCDVDVETVGGVANGRYLITRVARSLKHDAGATSSIAVVAPGILVF